jgi:hypothetical protein
VNCELIVMKSGQILATFALIGAKCKVIFENGVVTFVNTVPIGAREHLKLSCAPTAENSGETQASCVMIVVTCVVT